MPMPLLSATSAIEPALERTKSMLFSPFRFRTWLKIGFIGWLASGATSANFNFNVPSFPGGHDSHPETNPGQALGSWLHEHMLLIALIAASIVALGLAFIYLSSRFRFILFESVLQQDAQIARGWRRYVRPALRYLGFLLCFLLISAGSIAVIVGFPVWRAYKRGVFTSNDPFAFFQFFGPVFLGLLVFVIIGVIVTSLAGDFGVPLLALDDLTIGGAWRVLKEMVSAEPWAFAGYLGMKFVLSIAAGAMLFVAAAAIFLLLLIPGVIVVLAGVALAKTLGPVAGVTLAVGGGLVAAALALIITLLFTALTAVFFTSYSLYFFGGRYPKLGALLWPQPPAPLASPPPPVPPPPTNPLNESA